MQEKAGDFEIYDVISHKNEASEILVYFCFYIFVLKSLLFLFANVLSNVPRFHQKNRRQNNESNLSHFLCLSLEFNSLDD